MQRGLPIKGEKHFICSNLHRQFYWGTCVYCIYLAVIYFVTINAYINSVTENPEKYWRKFVNQSLFIRDKLCFI